MKPSKLEMYIGILETIGQQRLLQLTTIQDKTNVNLDYLKERIAFLVNQRLVEQRNTGKHVIYKNTQRGTSVLRYLQGSSAEKASDKVGVSMKIHKNYGINGKKEGNA